MPLEIAIDTRKKNGVLEPVVLAKINRLQKMLSHYPELSKPLSVVEFIKFINQAFHYGDSRYFIVPSVNDLSEIGRFAASDKGKAKSFKSFIDSSVQIARISVQMADIGSVKMNALTKELKPRIDSIFPQENYDVLITGNSRIFLKGNDYLESNLKESVLLSILLIAALMAMLFMSARMIGVAIIPSLIPLVITAGIMGFCNIALKPSTILVFSIAFGISSDGTLYFLTRYRQELKKNTGSISDAILVTIRETGISMLYVAFILFFGFSIFAASEFGGTKALGILISITLLVAMCSNLIVLPSFLASLEKRLLTKKFTDKPSIEFLGEEED